jgi:predicted MPP superfamily phosphohydrolase
MVGVAMQKRMTRKKKWLIFTVIVLALVTFLYFENNAISITYLEVNSKKLPPSFSEYKIVQLSDLHSKSFGKDQKRLADKVKRLEPDVIVFTGDLVDSKRYNEGVSLALMEQLVQLAPVYYVTGNHEWWSGRYTSLEDKLIQLGVKVLRNTHETITKGSNEISIIGIDDPAISNENGIIERELQQTLEKVEPESFKVLLSHRPEYFSIYSAYHIDLVFSGHAHGGQVRLPFIGGLVAPNQGAFPTYTAGKYENGQTVMVVNRGLGNSIIPQRLFNRPEIGVITLLNKGK